MLFKIEIPRGTKNPQKFCQTEIKLICLKHKVKVTEFSLIATFEDEPKRLMYKGFGWTSVASYH